MTPVDRELQRALADLPTLEELRRHAARARHAYAIYCSELEARDAKITAAYEVGVSPTKMARAIGLDRQLVYRIAKREQRGR